MPFIKLFKMSKKIVVSFSEATLMSSIYLFCLTNRPKPSNIQFTVIYDKETQQHEKVDPEGL